MSAFSPDDDMDLMSPSDALELVLELAQAQVGRPQWQRNRLGAERLADRAVLE